MLVMTIDTTSDASVKDGVDQAREGIHLGVYGEEERKSGGNNRTGKRGGGGGGE